MPRPVSPFIRTPVFWAATSGLGLTYLVGALIFARTFEVLNIGWLGRFDFGPSLLLGVLILYAGAWLFWRRSSGQPLPRAGWRGIRGAHPAGHCSAGGRLQRGRRGTALGALWVHSGGFGPLVW
jgi:hypothetical protein